MQKKKIIVYIFLLIIFSLIIYFSFKIYQIKHDNKKTNDEIEKIKEIVIYEEEKEINDSEEVVEEVIETPKLTLDFSKLKDINSDTVAWIRINNTNIDYPVVKGTDNSYYLNHSFYKEYNINGWVFESSTNSSYFDDDNTVIFAHNTNSYTMFSELKSIYNGSLGTDIDVYIYLENNVIRYKVFSVYLEDPSNTSNISKYLNMEMINEMKNKSKYNIDIDINEDRKILTLSTCNNVTNDRIIVHAVNY